MKTRFYCSNNAKLKCVFIPDNNKNFFYKDNLSHIFQIEEKSKDFFDSLREENNDCE